MAYSPSVEKVIVCNWAHHINYKAAPLKIDGIIDLKENQMRQMFPNATVHQETSTLHGGKPT